MQTMDLATAIRTVRKDDNMTQEPIELVREIQETLTVAEIESWDDLAPEVRDAYLNVLVATEDEIREQFGQ